MPKQSVDTFSGHPFRWVILVSQCIAIFCVAFVTTAIMNALPEIRSQLHMSVSNLQWAINAYTLACASLIIFSGRMADIFHRRKIFYLGMIIFIIMSIFIAFSHHGWQLILGRCLQGVGAALITPTTLSMLKVCFPHHQQKTAIAIWSGMLALGMAIGPLGGGILSALGSWRLIFEVGAALILLSGIILLFTPVAKHLLKNKKPFAVDWIELILLVLFMICFIIALVQGNTLGWTSSTVLGLFIAALILLIVFLTFGILRRHDERLVDLKLFAQRNFLVACFGIAITLFLLNDILYFFNLYVQSPVLLAFTALLAGLALLPANLPIFILSFFTSKLSNLINYRWLTTIAFIITAIGFTIISQVGATATYHALWFPLLLIGLGIGICLTSFPVIAMSSLPDKRAGEASGIVNTLIYLFATIGIAVGTILYLNTAKSTISHFFMRHSGYAKYLQPHVEKILVSHQGDWQQLLATLPQPQQHHLTVLAEQVNLRSYSHVMLLCAILGVVGAIISIVLLRSGQSK